MLTDKKEINKIFLSMGTKVFKVAFLNSNNRAVVKGQVLYLEP